MGSGIAKIATPGTTTALTSGAGAGQSSAREPHPQQELVIIDTDMGDDIDDAFAIGLALQSPEVKILGITTAWGNTALGLGWWKRFLRETGHGDIPVAVGIEKYPAKGTLTFSQARMRNGSQRRELPGSGGFFVGRDSKASGRDYVDCDRAGDESGGGDRKRCGDISEIEAGGADGWVGVSRV